MIQELLGGTAAFIGAERKISISGVLEASPSPSPSISPSPSPCSSTSSTTPASTTAPTNTSEDQNLRCPRCDSSNTKFCYYNNYNLTQPRHFCKTCRRYWTKGGALRNVPIGGGCRKNKNTTVTTKVGKASAAKVKTLPADIAMPGFVGGYDHKLPSNPLLWASPQNSQFLALLRSTQNPYPNPDPSPMNNSINVKEEAILIGSHMASSDPASVLDGRTLGLDTVSQVPSIGLCSPFLRNNQQKTQQHHQLNQHQQRNGFLLGEGQNSGIQEQYQRLRSSANYYPDHAPLLLGNMVSTTSSISTIPESAPVSGGESGYWNPTLSWPDLQTTNGAYP